MAVTESDQRGLSTAANWRTPLVIVVCGCLIGMLTFGPRSTLGFFMQPMSRDFSWGREVFGLGLRFKTCCGESASRSQARLRIGSAVCG